MSLVDLKSNLAKRTANVSYVNNTVDSGKSPSPIEISHNTAKIQFSNPTEGGPSTRNIPGYPLGQYYSQLNGTETQLGIRKSSKFRTEQPFVVRNIGDNWDNVSSNDFNNMPGQETPPNSLPPYVCTSGISSGLFVTASKFSPKKLYILSSKRIFSIGATTSPFSTQKQAYLVIPVMRPPILSLQFK